MMGGWVDGRVDGWTDGQVIGWMDGWTDRWMQPQDRDMTSGELQLPTGTLAMK